MTGNVGGPALRARLTRLLGDIPPTAPLPARDQREPRPERARRAVLRAPVPTPRVAVAWGAPPFTSPEGLATRTAIRLAAAEVREVAASFDTARSVELVELDAGFGGVAVLVVEGKPGDTAADLESDVLGTIDDRVIVLPAEAREASAAARAELFRDLDRAGPRARALAALRVEQGSTPSIAAALAHRNVSQAEIVDALVRRVRSKAHRAVVLVTPDPSAPANGAPGAAR